ncbi:hypothetical protein [Streptomyces yaizuensis]|uniref:SMI1/KNR4 family protein n=1 Tax=Streptomyces yaizuensis TaxID=2989713 RepID=A0ABQ5P9A8_9ACTN|nr:hypothetical protein [Streptomyces sp. YSPA8]GLF99178.1 hypothetical protein SYYSPA8_32795 [Streptomyces sp. YSPA8]
MTVHDLVTLLPTPDVLRDRCRALPLLDTVLAPYAPLHDFSPAWAEGVAVARMDNGSGDEYAIVFDPAGVLLLGFDHECDATPWRIRPRAHWPGLLDGLPAGLARHTADPAFLFDGFLDATVCVWREPGDDAWRCGPVAFGPDASAEPDGAERLFELVTDGTGGAYTAYAEDIHELSVDRAAVSAVLAGSPLERATVLALSPTADLAAVAARARSLGFPVADDMRAA